MTDIRRLREADTDAVVEMSLRSWEPVFASFREVWGAELFHRFYPDWRASQAKDVRKALDTNDTWVSVAGSTVTGFVSIIFDTDEAQAEVYMIAVDPRHQRDGIASALMAFAETEMIRRGITLATVSTGGDPGHAPARSTYEQAGYTPFPQVFYSKLLDSDAS